MIRIAIDGPGGAGKSSVAKAVAKELGIIYVDTGALYRTIGLYMIRHGIDSRDAAAVVAELGKFTLEMKFADGKQSVYLDGEDVGDFIRTPEVSMAASAVSAIGAVREFLLNTQRDIARANSVIMDGRDIGTVILPDAEVKIFLTASPKARALRRFKELSEKGIETTYEQVLKEMNERDKNDSTREIAPCVPAKDAVKLDNSRLTFEQTVLKVKKIIKKKTSNGGFYMLAHKLLGNPLKFFERVKVRGVENIPEFGGYVVCSNHIAKRDPILIAAAFTRKIHFIAKKELMAIPLLGRFLRFLGAISIDRSGRDVGAIKSSVELVRGGSLVCIFPQGHRYPGVNPATTPRKNGAALIASRAGAGVIPVCIKVKKMKYSLFCKKEIIIGKPIPYSALGLESGEVNDYAAATDVIFNEVVKLGGYGELTESRIGDSN